MKQQKIILLIILTFSKVGCSRTPNTHELYRIDQNIKKNEQENTNKIDDIIYSINQMEENCNNKNEFKNCNSKNYLWSDIKPKLNNHSVEKRILILDTSGNLPQAAIFPYHQSVIKTLVTDFDGEEKFNGYYRETNPSIQISDLAFQVNSKYIASLEQRKFILKYPELGEQFFNLLLNGIKIIPDYLLGLSHGEIVYEIIANKVPNAQFILAKFPEPGYEKYCSLFDENPHIRLKNQYSYTNVMKNYADELIKEIRYNEIDFFNLSYGPTLESTNEYFSKNCRNNQIDEEEKQNAINFIIEEKKKFIEKIVNETNVLLFIAGPNLSNHFLNIKNPFDIYNCFQNKRVLHIGYLSTTKYNIRKGGIPLNYSMLDKHQNKSYSCNDVYINSGFEEEENAKNYIKLDKIENSRFTEISFGIQKEPVPRMATSYATPLALSHVIYLMDKYKISKEEAADKIRGKMIDPLKYGEFLSDDTNN